MLEQYLLIKGTLGCSPDIEGQFQSYQEAADTMEKNIQAEYQKYVQTYGQQFIGLCDKDSRTGCIKTTVPMMIWNYKISHHDIIAEWEIKKIDIPAQGNSTLFEKEKKAVRQDVFDMAQNIRFSTGQTTSLDDAEVDEIVNWLSAPPDVLYRKCLRFFVQDALSLHEKRAEIRFNLAGFRAELSNLLVADPHTGIVSEIIRSLNNIINKIRLMFPDDPNAVPAALQSEFDQYAQLNDMLSAYLNSKAYCDITKKEHQNRCDDSEQEEEE